MAIPLPELHRRLSRWPGGRWLFSRLVCLRAPYFASISPTLEALEPGRAVATLRHRRRVTNHLGTVHAIALCNLAELAAGLATEAATPAAMRWIPRGMTVEYLARARGTMRATASLPLPETRDAGYDLPASVEVRDPHDTVVFRATIAMRISPRKRT